MKAALVLAVVLCVSVYASPVLENGGYLFFSNTTGEVLQVAGDQDNSVYSLSRFNGDLRQVWAIVSNPEQYSFLLATNSQKAIAVPDNSRGDVDLRQRPLVATATNQQWRVVQRHNGLVAFQSRSSGKFLTVRPSGRNAYQSLKDFKAPQLFRPFRVDRETPAPMKDGANYFFISGANSYALDITGISKADGAKLTTYPFWNGPNQIFNLKKVDDNAWRIVNIHSGKALSIDLANTNTGSHISQQTINDNDEQLWSFNAGKNGVYQINSILTGLNLVGTADKAVGNPAVQADVDADDEKQGFWAVEIQ